MSIEDLVEKSQQGDPDAMAELCKKFEGLIKKSAGQPYIRLIYEEALSTAYVSFIEAVKTYRVSRKIPFAGYAQSKVHFAVWNLFKRERIRWQREITIECEKSPGITILDDLADPLDIAQQTETRFLIDQLLRLMDTLPAKQRQVILYTLVAGKNLTETAADLHSTPQAIYGLKKRAIEQLKAEIAFYFM